MNRITLAGLITMILLLVACGSTPQAPTAAPTLTPFPTREPQATRTPINNPVASPTPIFNNQPVSTTIPQATAFVPATFTPIVASNSGTILTNGRGLTNGASVSNGEFQVEGYCNILNPSYGVAEDGTDWYCTFQGQRALTLRQTQFNDICIRTYSNPAAYSEQIQNNDRPAYRWRCFVIGG